MSANPKHTWTVEEYFAFERESETKHEYFNGEIFAMAGASRKHNVIVANVISSLHAQLRKKPCEIYPSDMRVRVDKTDLYTYPDVSIVCGEQQFTDDPFDVLTNPIVIIEILSPSTQDYDRVGKFHHYRALDSLQEYIMIAQEKYRIEHYVRQKNNQWLLTDIINPDAEIPLDSIDCSLLLSDIYEKVTFEDTSPED